MSDDSISLDNERTVGNTFVLSTDEKDALGEIGNICMGTSATTLSTLLGKRVTITTPRVDIYRGKEYLREYEKPVVATEISYTQGLDGNNIFLLKKEDALLITNLLMGGGQAEEDLESMYMSAISEVMNQMIGASSTALANILHITVNIAPPKISEIDAEHAAEEAASSQEWLVLVRFRMEIEDMLMSNIMQIMPFAFAKKLAGALLNGDIEEPSVEQPAMPAKKEEDAQREQPTPEQVPETETRPVYAAESRPLQVRTAKFQSFDETTPDASEDKGRQQNIDLIIDVPLQVTVVLGKTKKSVREILDMGIGSVIVLDKLAGEMVEVLVNGKTFARGEVVVIDDNYGVRITEMVGTHLKF